MGRMKSLGYAYAEHLGDGVDVDWYFESIVNGEIEIPKWFVEEWLEANPIFASENSGDYEVIMTNIGHSMERDGRVQVFGDVVFGLPENRRSRISSFGTGADKAEARQALIDRATGYLIEEEQLHDYMTRNHLESEEEYNAEGNSMLKDLAKVADKESNYYRHRENPDLSEIATELRKGQTSSDKKITLTHEQLIGVMCSSYKAGRNDILDNFDEYREWNAETKSWRMQKRDSKGRFTKGFVEEIDIGQFMEMDPEKIPLMPPITYTPQQVVEFINDCINMDNFPEQLMNSGFLDTLQQITASADLELLEGLNNAAHTSLIENGIYDDRAGMAAAKRAIFVTDVFLNFKWGQENWAAEEE